MTKIHQKYIIS